MSEMTQIVVKLFKQLWNDSTSYKMIPSIYVKWLNQLRNYSINARKMTRLIVNWLIWLWNDANAWKRGAVFVIDPT